MNLIPNVTKVVIHQKTGGWKDLASCIHYYEKIKIVNLFIFIF